VGLTRYARHHVREEIAGKAGFDCLTSFVWRDAAAFDAVVALLASRDGEAIRRDEECFMDKAANHFCAATEMVLRNELPVDPTLPTLVVAVSRPRGAVPEQFQRAYEACALPELLRSLGSPLRCAHDRTEPLVGREPRFDSVTWIRFAPGLFTAAVETVNEWAEGLMADGVGVVAVRASVHETLPP
jgi:hypothetical protein